MIPKHALAVNAMTREVQKRLRIYFLLPERWRLSAALAEHGYGQADVVLALLRLDQIPSAEMLMGHGITHCPPCLRPRAPLDAPDNASPDRRRIARVGPNERHPNTGAHYRFGIFRPGMTIEQFLVRGGTRLDLRIALRRGLVELEQQKAA